MNKTLDWGEEDERNIIFYSLKCLLDKYVHLRNRDGADGEIDERMTVIVERMFERCYIDGGAPQISLYQ